MEQVASGLGLEAQERSCRAWCQTHGVDSIVVYRDEGVSGSKPMVERPGLLQAVYDLAAGDILLVAKRDRLARNAMESMIIEKAVEGAECRVVSAAGEGTEDDAPASKLMRMIIDAVAEYERRIIVARTKATYATLAAKGQVYGHIPYGQRAAADGQHKRRCPNKDVCPGCVNLESHPEEQAVIAYVSDLRAKNTTWRSLAEILNKTGRRNRKGGTWTPMSLWRCTKDRLSPQGHKREEDHEQESQLGD